MPGIAQTDEQIEACFGVMAELRPQLTRAAFLPTVRSMAAEGYRLAYLEHRGEVAAVAGYRITTSFFLGRHLYIDDLVTAARFRSQGHGETLLRWLEQEAIREECTVVDLESGTQRSRAHRFYFREGYAVDAFHFSKRVDAG